MNIMDNESGVPPTGKIAMSKLAIVRNLAIISTSFLLCFTANTGTRNLQSSLYPDNLGNKALTILDLSGLLSNLLLSTLVLCKLGLKWSLVTSLLLHVAFPVSNLLPTWYSMFTGAMIMGIGCGPLWNAKSVYLTLLGEKYAELNGESPEVVISRFFGIFFFILRGSMFASNVISSVVIRRPPSLHGQSADCDVIVRSLCGAHYCYQDLDAAFECGDVNATGNSLHSIYRPTTFQTNVLFGIYVVCALLAVPLSTTVDVISTSADERKSSKMVDALLATLRHMTNPKEILLIPLSFLSGVTAAFITTDYCVGFITCSIGMDNVGYVMAVFGGAAGIGAVVTGPMLKYVGRKVIFAFGAICNAAAIVGMLAWLPGSNSMAALCIFAGLWGIANAIWVSQLVAFIAVVFHDGSTEAAFTCNYVWQMGGMCLWHAVSTYMCLNVQIYVIAVILTLGLVGYTVTEFMLRAEVSKQADFSSSDHRMDEITPVFTVEKFTYLISD